MIDRIRIIDIDELVRIIDFERNAAEGIDVSKLYVNSSKKTFWKCQNGHSFKEKVCLIYRRKNKCFYCTGRQIMPGENDLQTLYPELAKEFDVEKNGISPDRISPKDTESYWWNCGNNHPSFFQSVSHRVQRNTKCPYCTGRKALSGVNDLEALFPEIAKEWDVDGNGGVLPKDVPAFTYKSYSWICPKGHSYKKKVVQRTKYHKPIDCPKCIKAYSTSFPEQAVYYYVKKCFPDAINKYKEPFDHGMELDIYIPSYRIGIEYDGYAFHQSEEQHKSELKKYSACKQLGIKLFRIKESEATWNDTSDYVFYVKKRMNDETLSTTLYTIFSMVFSFKMHSFSSDNRRDEYLNRHFGFPTDFNISRDRPEILEYLVDVEQSFGIQHPELSAMWSKTANGNLTPYMFTSGSNYMATWECPVCGNSWKSPISSIVSRKVKSCKACSMRANGKATTKARTEKNGSLAEKSKELLKQWDYEANANLSPYEITLNYSKKVSWKCDTCGYKWSSSPNSRVRGDKISACPHCTGRVALSGVDDLETLYPDLAKEWDCEKNNGVLPSQIKPFSNKKYYWLCPNCGNSYPAYPGNRIKGSGCPECARIEIGKKNSKEVGQFDENGTLINTYQSLHRAAEVMQVNTNAIFQAVKNQRKSKGFYWRYV